jgi:hypothetical protein
MAPLVCRFRDPICTFFEAPVLAAGVFALACEDAEVDPTTYMAASEDISSMVALTWLETFDVAEDEVEGERAKEAEQTSGCSTDISSLYLGFAQPVSRRSAPYAPHCKSASPVQQALQSAHPVPCPLRLTTLPLLPRPGT